MSRVFGRRAGASRSRTPGRGPRAAASASDGRGVSCAALPSRRHQPARLAASRRARIVGRLSRPDAPRQRQQGTQYSARVFVAVDAQHQVDRFAVACAWSVRARASADAPLCAPSSTTSSTISNRPAERSRCSPSSISASPPSASLWAAATARAAFWRWCAPASGTACSSGGTTRHWPPPPSRAHQSAQGGWALPGKQRRPPARRMPAFSVAIAASVDPRMAVWS